MTKESRRGYYDNSKSKTYGAGTGGVYSNKTRSNLNKGRAVPIGDGDDIMLKQYQGTNITALDNNSSEEGLVDPGNAAGIKVTKTTQVDFEDGPHQKR